MLKNALLLVCLMTSLIARVSAAGDVLYYGAHETPDPDVVARILSEPAKVARPMKMRSIRLIDEKVAQAQDTQTAANDTPATQAPRYPTTVAQSRDYSNPMSSGYTATVAQAGDYDRPANGVGPSALGLPVQFAFDSARLLPQTMAQLDALAEGIRRTDPGVRVLVEGHTDAVGAPEYNLRLSAQRAEAVKRYLVSRHGIDPQRLRVVGKGMFAPIEGRNPFAAENRRVEFRADIG